MCASSRVCTGGWRPRSSSSCAIDPKSAVSKVVDAPVKSPQTFEESLVLGSITKNTENRVSDYSESIV